MNPKIKTESTPKLTKNKSNGNSSSSSSRFLLCCGPQALDINMNASVSVKQGVVIPRGLPADAVAAAVAVASLCGDDVAENTSNKEKNNDPQIMKKMKKKKKSKGNHPRLLGILKAVFFETSVERKIRNRKLKQKIISQANNGNDDDNSIHKELSEVDNNTKNNTNESSSVSNTSPSSLYSSSSACSSSFSSKSSSDDTNRSFRAAVTGIEKKQKGNNTVQVQKQQGIKGFYSPNVGLCFIIISLFILIIWGKLCAIFCTSMCLFFGARWKISNQTPETVTVDPRKLDSEEYKKKIIMEGLLERDHFRSL